MDKRAYYIPHNLLYYLFLLLVILKQASSWSGSEAKSLKLAENWMSPKLSEVKIDTVELFIITLTDYLGGCTKPLRSSLTNNKSPSLTTHGSSLWAL